MISQQIPLQLSPRAQEVLGLSLHDVSEIEKYPDDFIQFVNEELTYINERLNIFFLHIKRRKNQKKIVTGKPPIGEFQAYLLGVDNDAVKMENFKVSKNLSQLPKVASKLVSQTGLKTKITHFLGDDYYKEYQEFVKNLKNNVKIAKPKPVFYPKTKTLITKDKKMLEKIYNNWGVGTFVSNFNQFLANYLFELELLVNSRTSIALKKVLPPLIQLQHRIDIAELANHDLQRLGTRVVKVPKQLQSLYLDASLLLKSLNTIINKIVQYIKRLGSTKFYRFDYPTEEIRKQLLPTILYETGLEKLALFNFAVINIKKISTKLINNDHFVMNENDIEDSLEQQIIRKFYS